MLATLRIRNLALVEELEWTLSRGFVAVTGETGSGKSIIVGALKLLLGERAERSLIRTGADTCTVEALFQLDDSATLNSQLEEQGIDACGDDQLLLKRVFSASGANRQFINCCPTTLAVLRAVAAPLVDLHGPHDHQSLLSRDKQLELLDGFAAVDRSGYAAEWRRWQERKREFEELSTSEAALERELDLLRHQVGEIEAADLKPEEEDTLLAAYSVATNSRRLLELSTQICQRLSEADDAVLPQLTDTQRLCRELERIDPSASELAEAHTRAVVELEELARSLQDYASRLDLDPAHAAQLEERVTLLETLKRKYGPTLADVIAFGENASERLRRIESREAELSRLEKEIAKAHAATLEAGDELSRLRHSAAPKLSKAVRKQLNDLGFRKADFEVSLERLPNPGSAGLETVQFLICPNPGEPLKPLEAIASSGEISRLMLAVKSALAEQDTIPLMVFDEIDANVGGEMGNAIGEKLRTVADSRQVVCITHLPQVAARGRSHLVVNKTVRSGRTSAGITPVCGNDRVEEVARMLGGKDLTSVTMKHAAEMLGRKK